MGTASFARGQRGIETDTKEFLALKFIIQANTPNPFLTQQEDDSVNLSQIKLMDQSAQGYRFSMLKKKDLCVMV